MNIDKQIAAIPEASSAARAGMRENANRWLATGAPDQKEAAGRLLEALDAQDEREAAARSHRVGSLPVGRRVIEAFTRKPMTENERTVIQVLLDRPGATSTELSRAYGHDNMIWQMHFGNLCKAREADLRPAEKADRRDGNFYSGILADIDAATNRFTMKPEVTEAFAALGLKPARHRG